MHHLLRSGVIIGSYFCYKYYGKKQGYNQNFNLKEVPKSPIQGSGGAVLLATERYVDLEYILM